MLRKTTYSSALILATASSAYAGGLAEPVVTPTPMPVVAAAPVSGSDWSGFYLGGSFGKTEIDDSSDTTLDAKNYGVHAGYMYDMGSIVVGGELEYDNVDIDDIGDSSDASVIRLKGRVGYDAGAFLPYLTAGGAQLRLENGADVQDEGYFYGIGAEYAINDNFRVGGEVLQHEFDDFNDSGEDLSARTMALRVSYSF